MRQVDRFLREEKLGEISLHARSRRDLRKLERRARRFEIRLALFDFPDVGKTIENGLGEVEPRRVGGDRLSARVARNEGADALTDLALCLGGPEACRELWEEVGIGAVILGFRRIAGFGLPPGSPDFLPRPPSCSRRGSGRLALKKRRQESG